MKKFKLIPLLLIICLAFSLSAPAAAALSDPDLPARAAVLIDLKSGQVLYSKNMDEQRSPASLTKIMTALLALEAIESGKCTMDTMITAQDDCRTGMDESSSTSGIVSGVTLSLKELLYCALLQSANEACNIIASYLGGSIESFVGMMNQRAQELGCTNTNFVTTNGLSADGHYSSAYDLSLITREAMKHPDFITICNTESYTPSSEAVNGGETMYNSNALLTPNSIYGDSYVYEYASGVKTGYTRAAGYCLISTAAKDDINVLAVVLGCDGLLNASINEYKNFEASINLYNWAFDGFSYRTVLSAGEPLAKANVQLAKNGTQAILRPQEDINLLLPTDLETDDISTTVSVYEEKLVAPIKAGTVLGEAALSINGEDYGTIKLVSSADIDLSKGEYFKIKLREIFSNGWVIALIVIVAVFGGAYLVLVLRYRSLRKKHLEERKRLQQRRRAEMERRYYESQDFRTVDDPEQDYREFDGAEFESFGNDSEQKFDDFGSDEL